MQHSEHSSQTSKIIYSDYEYQERLTPVANQRLQRRYINIAKTGYTAISATVIRIDNSDLFLYLPSLIDQGSGANDSAILCVYGVKNGSEAKASCAVRVAYIKT